MVGRLIGGLLRLLGPNLERGFRPASTAPAWWLALMVAGSAIYLVAEFAFNAVLVDAAARGTSGAEVARNAELLGRVLSGIGATLLVADWLLSHRRLWGVARLVGLPLVALLVWPTVFFGQAWLVNELLIDQSSADERKRAIYSQAIKEAIATGAAEFEEAPLNQEAAATPAGKTFLALFGALAFKDPDLLDRLEAQHDKIALAIAERAVLEEREKHFAAYLELMETLGEQHKAYLAKSQEYAKYLEEIRAKVKADWDGLETQIVAHHKEYLGAVHGFEAKMDARAQLLTERMVNWFEHRNRCEGNPRCLNRRDELYDQLLKEVGIDKKVPYTYWVQVKPPKPRAEEGGVRGGVRKVLSTLGVRVNGRLIVDEPTPEERGGTFYTNDVGHYRALLEKLYASDFEADKKGPGLPLGLKDPTAFRAHPKVADKIRAHAAKQGIQLPAGWRINDQATFYQAAADAYRRGLDKRWDSRVSGQQLAGVQPGLGWEAFLVQPQVQAIIQKAMGPTYSQPIRDSWKEPEFRRRVLEPYIKRVAAEGQAMVKARLAEFEADGHYEERGKSALRATLVPPISMGLSLFLALVTLLKLPAKIKTLANSLRKAQLKAQPTWRRRAVPAAGLAAIVVIPLAISLVAPKESVASILIDRIESEVSLAGGLGLRWVLYAEPLVLPAGAHLDHAIGLSEGFGRIAFGFDRMDQEITWERLKSGFAPASSI